MTGPNRQPPEDDPSFPRNLISDLSMLYGRSVEVPKAIDEVMFEQSRRHGARIHRLKVLLRWGGGVAAVAAVLLVAIRLVPSAPVYNPGNHVTILDAFSLARQLKNGSKPDKSWDVNKDGVIDQKDVDAIAARAVQLPKGGVQ